MDFKWFRYLKIEIWRIDLATVSKAKARWIRFLRLCLLVSQGFTKSQIQQGASTLTYYSLLAFVPVIALLIGISRGFNLEKSLKNWILGHVAEQKEVVQKIFDFADQSLETAQQGLIAGIGVVILIWACVKILIYLEQGLNTIWEVKRGRTITKQFTDYLALILLFPIIVFFSSGANLYLTTALTAWTKGGILGPILVPLLNLIPIFLTCLLFTFLYLFLPNTHVRFSPALYAGLIAGFAYQAIQWLYLIFQIGVTRYNAIYGTFAAIPLFLIWIHLSWVIILLGAKIAFAIQNVNAFDFFSEDIQLSHRFRIILSLRITHQAIKKFCSGSPPPTEVEISNALSIPLPLAGLLIYQLVGSGVLSEVKRLDQEEFGFQPAKSVDQLTIKSVIDMINERGETIPLPPSNEIELILKSLDNFSQALNESKGNILLRDI